MADTVKELIAKGRAEAKAGRWDKAADVLSKAVEVLEKGGPGPEGKRQLSVALNERSSAYIQLGMFDKALEDATRASRLASEVRDLDGEAEALRKLGYIHWRKGDLRKAKGLYDMSLDRANRKGNNMLVGRTLIEMGNLTCTVKDYGTSEENFKRAIQILAMEEDISELARATNNLGSCYMDQGKYDIALVTFEKCIEICERAGDQNHMAWAMFNMADCYNFIEKPRRARSYLDAAQEILERTKDQVGLAITYLIYGRTHLGLDDLASAERSLATCLELLKELKIPVIEGEARKLLGEIHYGNGDEAKARKELKLALGIFEGADMGPDAEEIREMLKVL
jgi:tetratricopeptide (TPR) repeat protein